MNQNLSSENVEGAYRKGTSPTMSHARECEISVHAKVKEWLPPDSSRTLQRFGIKNGSY